MDELWQSVLNEIELEVSKGTFITFFKNTGLVNVKDSVATISTPMYMTSEYLEKRYYSLIKRILDKKLEKNTSLVFISQAKKGRQEKENIGPLFVRETKMVKKTRPTRIREDYTFEKLAVSESNRLAFTAAQTIAKSPGTKYNPLFLYGTVGVGKTHLMHAVANEIFEQENDLKVLYLTTEEFTNEFVEAIKEKTTTQLRKKFRNVDLLLLDDVQFLSGKERVQEELFHTFNSLVDKEKQIILSSDRPPFEIQKIEARLASRFEGGLSIDIQPPDFELRTAILLIKAVKFDVELPIELAKIVAEKINDARGLEGFLLRLSSEISTKKQPLSEKIVFEILGKKKEKSTFLRPEEVIQTVCGFYNIKSTQLKGAKRDAYLVLPRHVCMFLLKEDAGLTFVEIGNLLGGRDHTTVMHAVEKIGKKILDQGRVKEEIVLIKNRIKIEFLQ